MQKYQHFCNSYFFQELDRVLFEVLIATQLRLIPYRKLQKKKNKTK